MSSFQIPTFCGRGYSRSKSDDVTDMDEALGSEDASDAGDDPSLPEHIHRTECYLRGQQQPFKVLKLFAQSRPYTPDDSRVTLIQNDANRITSRDPDNDLAVPVKRELSLFDSDNEDVTDIGRKSRKHVRFSDPLVVECPNSPTDKSRHRAAAARRELLDEARATLPRTSYHGRHTSRATGIGPAAINQIVASSNTISLRFKVRDEEGGQVSNTNEFED